jgi:hypothetical protein
MAIVWLFIGLLMVIGPFLAFHVPMDPWPGVVAAGIGGGIFILVLFFFTVLRTPFSQKAKILSGAVLAILLLASFVSWKTMYDMTHFQRTLLGKIRTVIGDGIIEQAAYDAMYPPLRTFYEQTKKPKLPIGKIFLAVNKERIHDKVYRFSGDDFFQASLVSESDSTVTLLIADSVARGRDLSFANYNGLRGRLQFKAVLKEKGVSYEREN